MPNSTNAPDVVRTLLNDVFRDADATNIRVRTNNEDLANELQNAGVNAQVVDEQEIQNEMDEQKVDEPEQDGDTILKVIETIKQQITSKEYQDSLEELGRLRSGQPPRPKFKQYKCVVYIITPEFLPSQNMEDHFMLSAKQIFYENNFFISPEAYREMVKQIIEEKSGFLNLGQIVKLRERFPEVIQIEHYMNSLSPNRVDFRRVLDESRNICENPNCPDIDHHTFHLNFEIMPFARFHKITPV